MITWILAFGVHSTLWCSLAWLWTRLRPGTDARLRELIWYTAIAASFITPTAHLYVSAESAFWRVPLPETLVSSSVGEHRDGEVAEHHGLDTEGSVLTLTSAPTSWRTVTRWAWPAIGALLLLVYGARLLALRRHLGPRELIGSSTARRALSRLSRRAGLPGPPILTESENLRSPIALGLGLNREICVPTRALHELDEDQFRALLGHEVAHHLRRDTLRLGALHALQAVFFFQPLFRVAVRAIRGAVEEQCDDWAARQLDDRLAMASCLTEVASWVVRRDARLPVPCMARRRSSLRARVDRLLDERPGPGSSVASWYGLGSVGLLAVALWLAPAVAPVTEHPVGETVERHDRGVESEHRETERESREHDSGEHRRRRGEHDEREGEAHRR